MRSLAAAALLSFLLHAPGCESLRETAGTGQDLIENPARTAVVRGPAGLGAIAGWVLAVPFAAILVPTVWIPSTYVRNAEQGDIYISPVSASFDYGHGIGAAVLGVPFDAFEGIFRGPVPPPRPGAPPGTVDEVRELPPDVPDPAFDFSVKPHAVEAGPSHDPAAGPSHDPAVGSSHDPAAGPSDPAPGRDTVPAETPTDTAPGTEIPTDTAPAAEPPEKP
jgi:hypothetical protein